MNQETKISLTILNFHFGQLIQLTGHFDLQDLGKGEGGKIRNHIQIVKIDQLEQ